MRKTNQSETVADRETMQKQLREHELLLLERMSQQLEEIKKYNDRMAKLLSWLNFWVYLV